MQQTSNKFIEKVTNLMQNHCFSMFCIVFHCCFMVYHCFSVFFIVYHWFFIACHLFFSVFHRLFIVFHWFFFVFQLFLNVFHKFFIVSESLAFLSQCFLSQCCGCTSRITRTKPRITSRTIRTVSPPRGATYWGGSDGPGCDSGVPGGGCGGPGE